jgi:hypothetical protein
MLNTLKSYFSARPVQINRAPDRTSSRPASDTTPLLSSTASPKKSTHRVSNDIGNDPGAPTAQSFKLRCAKIPRQTDSSSASLTPPLKSTAEIRDYSEEYHTVMTDTETLFSKKEFSTTRKETKMGALLKGSKFASMIDKKTGGFLDPSTGLCCQLQPLKSGNYALCIPGIAPGKMFGPQLSASVQQFLGVGGVPEIYSQALKLAEFLSTQLENQGGKKLELTGHSMGGGIANYVGLKLDLPSVCFNAAALGRACLKDIGEVSPETLTKQIHVRMKNDFATHPPVTRKLMAFFSLGREKYVPRNVGVICEINTSDKFYPGNHGIMDRHLLDAMSNWYRRF